MFFFYFTQILILKVIKLEENIDYNLQFFFFIRGISIDRYLRAWVLQPSPIISFIDRMKFFFYALKGFFLPLLQILFTNNNSNNNNDSLESHDTKLCINLAICTQLISNGSWNKGNDIPIYCLITTCSN